MCTRRLRASSDDGGAFSRASNDSVSVPVDILLELGPASFTPDVPISVPVEMLLELGPASSLPLDVRIFVADRVSDMQACICMWSPLAATCQCSKPAGFKG